MDKHEFQARIERLGLPREEIAERLGLSVSGFYHQFYGRRPVSRQTEIILAVLERDQIGSSRERRKRSPRRAAAV